MSIEEEIKLEIEREEFLDRQGRKTIEAYEARQRNGHSKRDYRTPDIIKRYKGSD